MRREWLPMTARVVRRKPWKKKGSALKAEKKPCGVKEHKKSRIVYEDGKEV